MKKEINYFLKKTVSDLKKYEFKTFLIAIISGDKKNDIIEKPFKKQLGKKLTVFLKKEVDFKNPDILIQINLKDKTINYQIKPLYIYGRYQKIKAGIPQTRWYKKIYPTSVQEEIGNILLKYTKGNDHVFHGCGREDIDVLMLGNGRPFVLEIKNPKKRSINLNKLQSEINKNSIWVKVKNLSFTAKEKIKELKLAKPEKIYEAQVQLEKKVNTEVLKKAALKLSNIVINQQTPKRVLKRRYDLLRKRKIYYFTLKKYHPINPVFEIKTEAGTYIKELISGDEGRTRPSLSEILNQKCFVKELKVISINYP
ncbi:MAG: tRNA pseudouridine(54/55) synthase Pus10 [Microgenomates group bacterium]